MKFASTCLFVSNVPATMAFYKEAFGFREKFYDPEFDFGILLAEGGEMAIASHHAGERMMPGAYPRPDGGRPQGVELAFYSDDVEQDYARAMKAGAKSLASPYVTTWGQKVAYVRSPDGTILGICSPAEDREGG